MYQENAARLNRRAGRCSAVLCTVWYTVNGDCPGITPDNMAYGSMACGGNG